MHFPSCRQQLEGSEQLVHRPPYEYSPQSTLTSKHIPFEKNWRSGQFSFRRHQPSVEAKKPKIHCTQIPESGSCLRQSGLFVIHFPSLTNFPGGHRLFDKHTPFVLRKKPILHYLQILVKGSKNEQGSLEDRPVPSVLPEAGLVGPAQPVKIELTSGNEELQGHSQESVCQVIFILGVPTLYVTTNAQNPFSTVAEQSQRPMTSAPTPGWTIVNPSSDSSIEFEQPVYQPFQGSTLKTLIAYSGLLSSVGMGYILKRSVFAVFVQMTLTISSRRMSVALTRVLMPVGESVINPLQDLTKRLQISILGGKDVESGAQMRIDIQVPLLESTQQSQEQIVPLQLKLFITELSLVLISYTFAEERSVSPTFNIS